MSQLSADKVSRKNKNSYAGKSHRDDKMAQRLGELLVAEKMLSVTQLEEAVENQSLYGGRIGTSLIELGFLSEEEIAKTLCQKLRLPYIVPSLLMQIPPEVIALVPKKLACKHEVIPCRLEKKRLYLAMSDPTNLTIIDALAMRLGFIIVPVVVSEIRLMLALKKYYQRELSPRFHSLSQNLTACKDKDLKITTPKKAAQKKTHKMESQIASNQQIILEVADEDILDAEVESWPLLGDKESLDNLSEEEYQELINMPEDLRLKQADDREKTGAERRVIGEVEKLYNADQNPFSRFCKSLALAENRDDIASALIDYATPLSEGVALLMVKKGIAMGWTGVATGKPLADFDQLRIPLDQPSILQTVAHSKSYYLGSLTKEVNNILLSSRFNPQPPETVLVIPLLLCGRLVTLLYIQDADERLQQQLPGYQKLIDKTAMAFEMLILKNKILMG